MPRKDTSGPAFPTGTSAAPYAPGMTLRDYFAAAALHAAITAETREYMASKLYTFEESAAVTAYAFADAMLKARAL